MQDLLLYYRILLVFQILWLHRSSTINFCFIFHFHFDFKYMSNLLVALYLFNCLRKGMDTMLFYGIHVKFYCPKPYQKMCLFFQILNRFRQFQQDSMLMIKLLLEHVQVFQLLYLILVDILMLMLFLLLILLLFLPFLLLFLRLFLLLFFLLFFYLYTYVNVYDVFFCFFKQKCFQTNVLMAQYHLHGMLDNHQHFQRLFYKNLPFPQHLFLHL